MQSEISLAITHIVPATFALLLRRGLIQTGTNSEGLVSKPVFEIATIVAVQFDIALAHKLCFHGTFQYC